MSSDSLEFLVIENSDPMPGPLVSILLPVYNGAPYMGNAIRSVLSQSDRDFELIVSIDRSNDDSEKIVDTFHDPRIKIFKQQNRLGMTANYEFLISHAKGKWITLIGQDDALMPFALSELRKMTLLFPNQVIVTSRRSFVFWPDTNQPFKRFSFIYPIDRRKPHLVSSSMFLTKSISGFREYSEGPQLYTGSFVRMALIEQVANRNNGGFFTYSIPDVSSAVNLLLNTTEYIYSPLPLFLIGTSSQSTGMAIDQIVSHGSNPNSVHTISDFFSRKTQSRSVPGEGIFTSFSWYMYEAYLETIKYNPSNPLNSSYSKISKAALMALKFESKKSNFYSQKQKDRIADLVLNSKMTNIEQCVSQVKLLSVHYFRKVAKVLYALYLLVRKRLILSTMKELDSFSIDNLCGAVDQLVCRKMQNDSNLAEN
jgi:glycosyltransferase involved in cell wall biosynthesis